MSLGCSEQVFVYSFAKVYNGVQEIAAAGGVVAEAACLVLVEGGFVAGAEVAQVVFAAGLAYFQVGVAVEFGDSFDGDA